ncbi:hypothetical protein Hypma_014535 [Hypsizygus marmoreus]|uniref:Uncharacterized protein n=1 Tax=Hypsizygus marmoreus TaxID=39966 RepID=A0A369JHJ4_HYPMA|nr:hypothetical protein Hypma_014535 [Hypsizygus marmoreus]
MAETSREGAVKAACKAVDIIVLSFVTLFIIRAPPPFDLHSVHSALPVEVQSLASPNGPVLDINTAPALNAPHAPSLPQLSWGTTVVSTFKFNTQQAAESFSDCRFISLPYSYVQL